MNINFYLNDESETEIMHFYDQASNPFRGVGQVIHLSVEFLYPKLVENYSEEKKLEVYNDWEEKRNMFYNKSIKIVKEGFYTNIKYVKSTLTIEYHCEFCWNFFANLKLSC